MNETFQPVGGYVAYRSFRVAVSEAEAHVQGMQGEEGVPLVRDYGKIAQLDFVQPFIRKAS